VGQPASQPECEAKSRFPTNLTTERLALGCVRAEELSDYLAFYRNERTAATLGGVKTDDWVRQWLDRQLEHWAQHGFGLWTMRARASGEFLGRGGLRFAKVEGQHEVELGYGLLPEYWGLGLAAEMSHEALRLGFEVLRLNSIVSFTLPTNLNSRRVMEKAGLRYERDIVWADLPHVLYRIDRSTAQLVRSPDTSRPNTLRPPHTA
jgi:RimJ/RimL family protein N-acetyltransferase